MTERHCRTMLWPNSAADVTFLVTLCDALRLGDDMRASSWRCAGRYQRSGVSPVGGLSRVCRSATIALDQLEDLNLNKEQVISTLRAHEAELRDRGIAHAALFGSVARGEAAAGSDIDIMIELAPDAGVGVFEYVGIQHYLADLLATAVDLANQKHLKAFVRSSAERDAIYAF